MAEDWLGGIMVDLANEWACWFGKLNSMDHLIQADDQFFDVNLMYMLVQYVDVLVSHESADDRCTTHSTNGRDGPSRSWAFATAAYAICWGISIFIVWLGWDVYFEFWRKWRQSK
jgi:hypothetical protein